MIEALETKHYVSATGEYLGGFGGVRKHIKDPTTGDTTTIEEWPNLPVGAIAVAMPPTSQLDRFNGAAWVSPTAETVAANNLEQARVRIGNNPEILALIDVLADKLTLPNLRELVAVSLIGNERTMRRLI